MKAKKIDLKVELDEIIDSLKKFLIPVLEDDMTDISSKWNHKHLIWE